MRWVRRQMSITSLGSVKQQMRPKKTLLSCLMSMNIYIMVVREATVVPCLSVLRTASTSLAYCTVHYAVYRTRVHHTLPYLHLHLHGQSAQTVDPTLQSKQLIEPPFSYRPSAQPHSVQWHLKTQRFPVSLKASSKRLTKMHKRARYLMSSPVNSYNPLIPSEIARNNPNAGKARQDDTGNPLKVSLYKDL